MCIPTSKPSNPQIGAVQPVKPVIETPATAGVNAKTTTDSIYSNPYTPKISSLVTKSTIDNKATLLGQNTLGGKTLLGL